MTNRLSCCAVFLLLLGALAVVVFLSRDWLQERFVDWYSNAPAAIPTEPPNAYLPPLAPQPPPISEQFARDAVLQSLGGETAYSDLDTPSPVALAAAISAMTRLGIQTQTVGSLAVVDFTKPSYLRRMAIYSPVPSASTSENVQPLPDSQHLVSHGRATGGIYAEFFSNVLAGC